MCGREVDKFERCFEVGHERIDVGGGKEERLGVLA